VLIRVFFPLIFSGLILMVASPWVFWRQRHTLAAVLRLSLIQNFPQFLRQVLHAEWLLDKAIATPG